MVDHSEIAALLAMESDDDDEDYYNSDVSSRNTNEIPQVYELNAGKQRQRTSSSFRDYNVSRSGITYTGGRISTCCARTLVLIGIVLVCVLGLAIAIVYTISKGDLLSKPDNHTEPVTLSLSAQTDSWERIFDNMGKC
jgi:hypothetical protein